MSAKELKFDKKARKAVLRGIRNMAKAVGSTLGPLGKCVVISDYTLGKPYVTKDGVTVAKNIEFKDKYENVGAQLLKEAALKTVEKVGDSTTTSIVLAEALIRYCNKLIKLGKNPIILKKELEDAYAYAKSLIPEYVNTISEDLKDLDYIATISANNDESIGHLIGDAYRQVGKNGVVIVEESPSDKTYCDTIMGMQIASGYVANHFVTDSIKDKCELINPVFIITDQKIESARPLGNILNRIAKEGKSLVIIAQDFGDTALEAFKLNNLQGILKCCLVKAPSRGSYRDGLLKDVAVATGGQVLTYESGLELSDFDYSFLGSCEKVVVTKDTTTIIRGLGTQEEIATRAAELQTELDQVLKEPGMDGTFMVNFLQERIARLLSGIATIKVGGTTELEMKERKDRIDDAVCATKAALSSGYVRGGGVTYKDLAFELQQNGPKTIGNIALACALLTPICSLLKSANIRESYFKIKKKHAGYNVLNKEYHTDILNANVIDPAAACYEALANAMSITTLYLSLDCVVTPLPEITII